MHTTVEICMRTVLDLENHFNSEESSEDIVDVVENDVAETGITQWVLRSERDAASQNDDDDKCIKDGPSHEEMCKSTNSIINDLC